MRVAVAIAAVLLAGAAWASALAKPNRPPLSCRYRVGPGLVLLIGDSQTEWHLGSAFLDASPSNGPSVCFTGKGGRSSATFLSDPEAVAQVKELHPSTVIYEFGTNDAYRPASETTEATYPSLMSLAFEAGASEAWMVGPPGIRDNAHLARLPFIVRSERSVFGGHWIGSSDIEVGEDGVHVTGESAAKWAMELKRRIFPALDIASK